MAINILSKQQQWLNQLLLKLTNNRHRELLLVQGDDNWRQQWQQLILQTFYANNANFKAIEIVNVNSFLPAKYLQPITINSLSSLLGQEVDLVIYNSEQGINPNSLAQSTGMIKAGGLCVLSLQDNWLNSPNPAMQKYLSYPLGLEDGLNGFRVFFEHKLNQHAIIIQQDKPLPTINLNYKNNIFNKLSILTPTGLTPTKGQLVVVEAVKSVTCGHRDRPLLLNADRGRGKSSALGFAAIELFKQSKHHVAITAANFKQTKQIVDKAIEYAQDSNNNFKFEKNIGNEWVFSKVNNTNGQKKYYKIQFYAVDDLINNTKQVGVLFVDEAAHLSLVLLVKLIKKYKRIVFSSTNAGYEGSGMAFKLRFTKELNLLTPNWKKLTLKQPIRWNENDPLEVAINNSLLLSTKQQPLVNVDITNLKYTQIKIEQLIKQPKLVAEVFTLLVNAHYQTSPNNLMQMLEDPNVVIWLAVGNNIGKNGHVAAVLLAFKEGGLVDLTRKSLVNKRYQGHLVPQLLFTQTNQKKWLKQTSYRINRIAVHADLQGCSIGSNLVQRFVESIKNTAYISVSFGVSAQLINFWAKQRFTPAYLGVKKDKSSGTCSLVMLYGLNKKSTKHIHLNLIKYSGIFAYLLQSSFKQLDSKIVISLLKLYLFKDINLPINLFKGYLSTQPFEAIVYDLQQWSLANPHKIESLPAEIQTVWVKKIIQNQSWHNVLEQYDYVSRKKIEAELKEAMKMLRDFL